MERALRGCGIEVTDSGTKVNNFFPIDEFL